MSYRRNYQASVHYSGSVSISYPASQSGGSKTAYYSGNVPVSIAIDVITDPLDDSVQNCNRSLNVLSGSVVALQASQIAAIQQTAREVSQSLIDGFFGTIKTELSQQLQALDAAVKANFALLQEQSKAISAQQKTMETDYNRISSRYTTLFSDLDAECYKRIYALDKQSFTLSDKVQKELLSDTLKHNSALHILEIDEGNASQLFMTVSKLNRKSREVLQTLHEYINHETNIVSLINSYISNLSINEHVVVYAPVIYTEESQLDSKADSNAVFSPQYLDNEKKSKIARAVESFYTQDSKQEWRRMSDSEKELLNKEFVALTESHFEDQTGVVEQRVYNTMLELWKNTQIGSN